MYGTLCIIDKATAEADMARNRKWLIRFLSLVILALTTIDNTKFYLTFHAGIATK